MIILFFGQPASGKTTIADLFCEKIQNEGDYFYDFVRIDGDGKAIPIHQYVKDRYYERYEKYGKGLLSLDEKHNND